MLDHLVQECPDQHAAGQQERNPADCTLHVLGLERQQARERIAPVAARVGIHRGKQRRYRQGLQLHQQHHRQPQAGHAGQAVHERHRAACRGAANGDLDGGGQDGEHRQQRAYHVGQRRNGRELLVAVVLAASPPAGPKGVGGKQHAADRHRSAGVTQTDRRVERSGGDDRCGRQSLVAFELPQQRREARCERRPDGQAFDHPQGNGARGQAAGQAGRPRGAEDCDAVQGKQHQHEVAQDAQHVRRGTPHLRPVDFQQAQRRTARNGTVPGRAIGEDRIAVVAREHRLAAEVVMSGEGALARNFADDVARRAVADTVQCDDGRADDLRAGDRRRRA